MRPRRCFYLPPEEGVGNAGCPLHPRSRVHLVAVERTRVTTSTPESPGIPARNGFNGFLRALLGDRALLPPSFANLHCICTRLGRHNIRELDASVGASGPHDFAVRCNISRPRAVDRSQIFRPALQSIARKTLPRPPHSTPRFVTIMIRPSCGVGWRKLVEMICPTGEAKYFCKRVWTAQIRLKSHNKSSCMRDGHEKRPAGELILSRRSCESRDPYAVSFRFGADVRGLPSQRTPVVMVPAFAGTTPYVARLHSGYAARWTPDQQRTTPRALARRR